MNEHTGRQRNQWATTRSGAFRCFSFAALLFVTCASGYGGNGRGELPNEIRVIMKKPRYSEATWALRVVDLKSGDVIYNLSSQHLLLTASVRKLYSVGSVILSRASFNPGMIFSSVA